MLRTNIYKVKHQVTKFWFQHNRYGFNLTFIMFNHIFSFYCTYYVILAFVKWKIGNKVPTIFTLWVSQTRVPPMYEIVDKRTINSMGFKLM